MKPLSIKNRINMKPIKNLLYTLQVVVIALAIPVLCIVDLSHKTKAGTPTEISAQHRHLEAATVTSNI